MAIELNNNNFDTEIAGDTAVLVDFWASWCGPCRALAPILEKLANEPDCNVKICKVNVDQEPALSERFGIMSIPTLILFKNGQQVKKLLGVQSLERLKDFIS